MFVDIADVYGFFYYIDFFGLNSNKLELINIEIDSNLLE